MFVVPVILQQHKAKFQYPLIFHNKIIRRILFCFQSNIRRTLKIVYNFLIIFHQNDFKDVDKMSKRLLECKHDNYGV